jgi:uncharacterized membrane protein
MLWMSLFKGTSFKKFPKMIRIIIYILEIITLFGLIISAFPISDLNLIHSDITQLLNSFFENSKEYIYNLFNSIVEYISKIFKAILNIDNLDSNKDSIPEPL